MRATFVLLTALALHPLDAPRVDLVPGTSLAVELRTTTENRLDAMRMLEKGTVVGRLDTSQAKPSREERVVRFVDSLVALSAAGRPRIVERRFDELSQVLTTEGVQERSGPLQGRTLRLELSTANAETSAETETVRAMLVAGGDGASIDPFHLADHRVVDPVLHLLDGAEAAFAAGEATGPHEREGVRWPLDDALAFVLLGLVDDAEYFPGESEEKDRFERLLRKTAVAKGEARYGGIEERDGRRAWKVLYTIELLATSESFDPALVGIPKPQGVTLGAMRLAGKGTGELWIGCEERLPLERRFTLEADLDVSFGRGELGTEVELFVTHEEEQRWRPR